MKTGQEFYFVGMCFLKGCKCYLAQARLKFVGLKRHNRKHAYLQVLFHFLHRDRVVLDMDLHFLVVGVVREWVEILEPVALTRGIVKTRVRLFDNAVRSPKDKYREQRRHAHDNEKVSEPAILLKQIHGMSIGLRRSRWSS